MVDHPKKQREKAITVYWYDYYNLINQLLIINYLLMIENIIGQSSNTQYYQYPFVWYRCHYMAFLVKPYYASIQKKKHQFHN